MTSLGNSEFVLTIFSALCRRREQYAIARQVLEERQRRKGELFDLAINTRKIKTKRNCTWSPNAVMRILTNEIYTGKVVNGKQEISAFLTGQRNCKDEVECLIIEKESLRIVEQDV